MAMFRMPEPFPVNGPSSATCRCPAAGRGHRIAPGNPLELPDLISVPSKSHRTAGQRSRSPYFFRNLGECVLFQFLCVGVEFTDAFGQLLRRHSILVVHPAKSFLAEAQALIFACFRRCWVKFALDNALSLLQLIEQVGADGQ